MDADLADMVQMDTPVLAGLLGEALIQRVPYLDRVYLCNSGTETVESALKFARVLGLKAQRRSTIPGVPAKAPLVLVIGSKGL